MQLGVTLRELLRFRQEPPAPPPVLWRCWLCEASAPEGSHTHARVLSTDLRVCVLCSEVLALWRAARVCRLESVAFDHIIQHVRLAADFAGRSTAGPSGPGSDRTSFSDGGSEPEEEASPFRFLGVSHAPAANAQGPWVQRAAEDPR